MEKRYQPQDTEEKIYQLWEAGGYFTPQIDADQKPFVITLPPPNVTGGLHAGHAMYTVEDILVRYHRMLGQPTLWLPGFDHASIAVEYLVTKQLAQEGKTKQEIGREAFLERAHNFANQSRDYTREQLKKLGYSLDWSREAYTMDEHYSQAVIEAFQRLYQKGLIYKGLYLVNWCPKCQTAISDLENEYHEEEGALYFIKYGPITVATTRPETMFGDAAVAVNPNDARYQALVGQEVPLPLTNRQIPIIADAAVDLQFGTGALKITPAHDVTDFEIGQRHHLEALVAIDNAGKLTPLAGKFAGQPAVACRDQIVAALKEQGLLEKIEKINHNVGHCQRCGTTTESLISEQWFVKTKSLAARAIKAIETGEMQIIPKHFEKIYLQWLNNIRDWCISRQLWWGHRIPIAGETDILDTWFSSALWPIATLGWPEEMPDLQYFYPTTVRETGYDIIFFWVAREAMVCLELTGRVPFKIVYLHGLVRDNQGRKFSKTKGIGFDPLDIIQKYGTDALRMALTVGNAPGNDLKIVEEKIVGYRNFTNKIWNAARFILMDEGPKPTWSEIVNTSRSENPDDQKIVAELDDTIEKTTDHMEKYRFDLAAEELYHFFWHSFCDKYIETSKDRRVEAQPVLLYILINSLKLLHPFMPFVTEAVWEELRNYGELQNHLEPSITVAPWPK